PCRRVMGMPGQRWQASKKRGFSMTRCNCESTSQATKFSCTVATGSASKRWSSAAEDERPAWQPRRWLTGRSLSFLSMLMMAVNRYGDVFQYFITSSYLRRPFSSLFGQLLHKQCGRLRGFRGVLFHQERARRAATCAQELISVM